MDPVAILSTSDNTEQLISIIQYLSNNENQIKEVIFWLKSISYLAVMIVVISAFSIFSTYLKGLSKK